MAEGYGQEVAWLEELVDYIRALHDRVLSVSGGAAGEHAEALEASCARPFQSALGEPVFPTPTLRAAALLHGIISSHAFVDGNKRTACIAAVLGLIADGVLSADPTKLRMRLLGEVAIEVASTGLTVEEVAFWFERILLD